MPPPSLSDWSDQSPTDDADDAFKYMRNREDFPSNVICLRPLLKHCAILLYDIHKKLTLHAASSVAVMSSLPNPVKKKIGKDLGVLCGMFFKIESQLDNHLENISHFSATLNELAGVDDNPLDRLDDLLPHELVIRKLIVDIDPTEISVKTLMFHLRIIEQHMALHAATHPHLVRQARKLCKHGNIIEKKYLILLHEIETIIIEDLKPISEEISYDILERIEGSARSSKHKEYYLRLSRTTKHCGNVWRMLTSFSWEQSGEVTQKTFLCSALIGSFIVEGLYSPKEPAVTPSTNRNCHTSLLKGRKGLLPANPPEAYMEYAVLISAIAPAALLLRIRCAMLSDGAPFREATARFMILRKILGVMAKKALSKVMIYQYMNRNFVGQAKEMVAGGKHQAREGMNQQEEQDDKDPKIAADNSGKIPNGTPVNGNSAMLQETNDKTGGRGKKKKRQSGSQKRQAKKKKRAAEVDSEQPCVYDD